MKIELSEHSQKILNDFMIENGICSDSKAIEIILQEWFNYDYEYRKSKNLLNND